MAQTNPANGQESGQSTEPQMMLQKIYVKDSSFEAPNAPQVFQQIGEGEAEPEVQLNLGHQSSQVADDVHEVVLTLTLTCTMGEHTIYLAEVHQAGIFTITGFNEQELAGILGSYCPSVLFPYGRQVVSALVLEGGFPPFLLQPINFEALYNEQMRRQAEGDAAPTLNS